MEGHNELRDTAIKEARALYADMALAQRNLLAAIESSVAVGTAEAVDRLYEKQVGELVVASARVADIHRRLDAAQDIMRQAQRAWRNR